LFPSRAAEFAARLSADLDAIPDGPSRSAGIALGAAVARAAVDARAADGAAAAAVTDEALLVAPGLWRPTPPRYAPPLAPGWGAVTPFGIPSTAVFMPPPPPALDAPEYAAEVATVKALGASGGAVRTADETQLALFWADGAGTETPPGHWNSSAAAAAVLASFFSTDDLPFTSVSDALGPTVTRSFAGFSAAAAEAGMSRIYGGIHFPSGNTAGAMVGRAIGDYVAAQLFAPVPEPGSAWLAMAGCATLLAWTRARAARGDG
jgi:hypothetical protein